jgi:hypothetical protein
LGVVYLRPAPLKAMGETMAWGAAFAANIGLEFSVNRAAEEAAEHVRMAQAAASGGTLPAGSTDGYWGAMNTKNLLVDQGNPLVHLWSLGVEEQFYILWPVVVPFIMR